MGKRRKGSRVVMMGVPDAELAAPEVVRRRPDEKLKQPKSVRYDYIKSQHFRVMFADGFHGGLTPHGKIHMAVFNERRPIARSEGYRVTDQGAIGELEYRIERGAIIREVEASILMDLDKAVALRLWLDKLLAMVEELQVQARKKRR
jgi:hypothetical protein